MSKAPLLSMFLLVLFTCFVIFVQTSSRIAPSEEIPPQQSSNTSASPPDYSTLPVSTKSPSDFTLDKESYDEWCEVRDYKDLSGHHIFKEFNGWINQYNEISTAKQQNLNIHDVRYGAFYEKGLKISLERANVLKKIIRGDPRSSLRLAISKDIINRLPAGIRENLETWQADFVDLDAVHVCFDPKHPKGLVKRWVTFTDGRKLRAWVFGKRQNLTTLRGLAIWGIFIGDDMAIGEVPYRTTVGPQQQMLIQLGHKTLSYDKEYEKDFFVREIEKLEKESTLESISVRYPNYCIQHRTD